MFADVCVCCCHLNLKEQEVEEARCCRRAKQESVLCGKLEVVEYSVEGTGGGLTLLWKQY